jgi:hypothetical protein
MEFINSDKVLERLVKKLNLKISLDDHNYLVCELFRHIDYTRRQAYHNGYEQGKFDVKADELHTGQFTLSHKTEPYKN